MISKLPKWAADLTEKSGSIMSDMQILDTAYISPGLKRIRFQGDLSRMNFQVGYANVIRVSNTEFRNYTAAYHDVGKGILDILFHIHGNGAGSQYVDLLKSGEKLRISIPRGRKFYEPNVKHQFIFGDETSLGLACAILPFLKENKHQYRFYFELDEENKNVPELLGLGDYTTFLKNGTFRNEKEINDLPIFQTSEWQESNFILTENVNIDELSAELHRINGIENIHDLHVWSIDGSYNIGSLHAVVNLIDKNRDADILLAITQVMEQHQIQHPTVQMEAIAGNCRFVNC